MKPEDELLSNTEIRTLAGCVARDAQCEKLGELGVPYRRDGARILVSRVHVRQWLSGVDLARSTGGVRLDLVR